MDENMKMHHQGTAAFREIGFACNLLMGLKNECRNQSLRYAVQTLLTDRNPGDPHICASICSACMSFLGERLSKMHKAQGLCQHYLYCDGPCEHFVNHRFQVLSAEECDFSLRMSAS